MRTRECIAAAALALCITIASPRAALALCGDGQWDAGEQCDDGNLSNGDCCSSTCTTQVCSSPAQPGVAWQDIGPNAVGGRVTSLSVSPSNPQRILIGTPGAGVWRSDDRGATWVAIAPWLDVAPVSAIDIDPANANRYVVSTGVLQDSGTTGDAVGSVLTSDAGQSWTFQADPTRRAYVGDVRIWAGEPSRVLFATERGLLLSLDGGVTQTEVRTGDAFSSVIQDPFDADVAYASGSKGFYRSLDRGASWAFVGEWPGVDDFENPGAETAVLAASHQTQGLLRAAVQDLSTFVDTGRVILLESHNGGASWTELTAPAGLCTATDRCGFANALAIDPANDARMLLGGDRLFRSLDGGTSWTALASTVRGVHEIAIDAQGAVVTGRSGVAVLDPTWLAVVERNAGLPITGIVSLDSRGDGSGALLAGTADSGTILRANSAAPWKVVFGAKESSSQACFDRFDDDVLYAGLRRGDFSRSDDGGTTWHTITSGLSPTQISNDVTPLAVNPLREGELTTGQLQLFRSTNRGDSWSAYRPLGAPQVSLIENSPVIADRLYFALSKGGTLFKTDSIHTDTFVLDPALDARITAILPDPGAENRVYVGMTNSATLRGTLWRTENFGTTWEDRSFGVLPAVNDVVKDGFGTLYAATSEGVFRSSSEGFVWSAFNEALPSKAAVKLALDGDRVVLGTRGRGLFSLQAKPLVAIDTIPPGQRLLVDGVVHDGPVFADWIAGSSHTIAPYLVQTEDTRQRLVSWTNGGPQSQTFVATGGNDWPTALLEITHRLRTSISPTAGGTLITEPFSANGFYPYQSFVQLIAVPAPAYRIAGFTGDVSSVDRLLAGVQMDRPRTVVAHFEPLEVRFATDPPGLSVGIDAQSFVMPHVFQWEEGSLHPLNPPASVDLDPSDPLELVFDHWSDFLPRAHPFQMRSDTFTADVTARYLSTVRNTVVPAGGVQRIDTQATDDSRREAAVALAPSTGQVLPASLQFLRSVAPDAGVTVELAQPRARLVNAVDTFVEGRALQTNGGLTGDGRIRRTRLVLFNPGASPVSVDLFLRKEDGTPTAGGTNLLQLAPGRQKTVYLDQVLGLPKSYAGLLSLKAGAPVVVSVLGVTENLRHFDSTDPILFHLFDDSDTGLPSAATTQVLLATPDTEHVVVLVNTNATTSVGVLKILDRDGAPLQAMLDSTPASSVPFSLAAGTHRVLRLKFPTGVPGAETLHHARLAIQTTSGPAPLVRHLEERAIGTSRYGTSTLPRNLPPSVALTSFSVPVDLTRRDTGLVFSNPGTGAGSVTLTLRDAHGTVTGAPYALSIPAGAQRLVRASELLPPPPQGFYGQIVATATSGVAAVAFGRTSNLRGEEILSGYPVLGTPTDAPDTVHRFALAVDGDTWGSEWWLLSAVGTPRNMSLAFRDTAGVERFFPMLPPRTP